MTLSEIKKTITDKYIAEPSVIAKYGLEAGKTFDEQFSVVAWESIVFSIQALMVWSLVKLFEFHKQEVTDTIATMKPHSPQWYAEVLARNFQYGFALIPDTDKYNNTGKTEAEIVASKIIAYAAVMEIEETRQLRIKVAKDAGDLSPLSSGELLAFNEYMKRVRDAGVFLDIISEPADLLSLELKVYYDPLVLNDKGQRVDGTEDRPVNNAVKEYLKNMPFNGWVAKTYIADALQAVHGIVIPHISKAMYAYGSMARQPFEELYLPESGYMRLDDLKVTYIAQTTIQ